MQIYLYDVHAAVVDGTPAIRTATDRVITTKAIIITETKVELGIEHNVRLFWSNMLAWEYGSLQ